MSLMLKIFFLLVLFVITSIKISAEPNKSNHAYFVGIFEDNSVGQVDSVRVVFWRQDPSYQPGWEDFFLKLDRMGAFSFQLPLSQQPVKMSLFLYGARISKINDYFVETGDSILMKIKYNNSHRVEVAFSGKGVAKYICRDLIAANLNRFLNEQLALDQSVNFAESNWLKYRAILDSGISRSMFLLDLYMPGMTSDMYQLMKGEHLGFYLQTSVGFTKWFLKNSRNESERGKIIGAYYHDRKIFEGMCHKDIVSLSLSYLRYHLSRNRFELTLQNNGDDYEFADLYMRLRDNYSGLMRERLLVNFFDDPKNFVDVIKYKQEDFDRCVADAFSLTNSVYIKNILGAKLLLKKGADVFDFSLPDESGKVVGLKDFRGKVILLDIWGERCSGCANFAKKIDGIYPSLKDHNDFAMVSVSIDETRERWIRGLRSGLYTNEFHVNLWTEGLGLKHPFVKYYDINAIPFILLIDRDGNVHASIQPGIDKDELLFLINQALLD